MSKNNRNRPRNNLGTKNKVSRCLFFCLKNWWNPTSQSRILVIYAKRDANDVTWNTRETRLAWYLRHANPVEMQRLDWQKIAVVDHCRLGYRHHLSRFLQECNRIWERVDLRRARRWRTLKRISKWQLSIRKQNTQRGTGKGTENIQAKIKKIERSLMWGCFCFACLKFDIDLLEQHNSEKGLLMVFAVRVTLLAWYTFPFLKLLSMSSNNCCFDLEKRKTSTQKCGKLCNELRSKVWGSYFIPPF